MNTGNIEACIELAQVRAGHGDATPAEALAELAALKLRAAAPPKIDGVLAEITAERAKQDAQWGGLEHDDELDLADWPWLIDKFMQRAMCEPHRFRDSMVKIAALAVAAIESHDRKETT